MWCQLYLCHINVGKPCGLERGACGVLRQDCHRPRQSAGSRHDGRQQEAAPKGHLLGDERNQLPHREQDRNPDNRER